MPVFGRLNCGSERIEVGDDIFSVRPPSKQIQY